MFCLADYFLFAQIKFFSFFSCILQHKSQIARSVRVSRRDAKPKTLMHFSAARACPVHWR